MDSKPAAAAALTPNGELPKALVVAPKAGVLLAPNGAGDAPNAGWLGCRQGMTVRQLGSERVTCHVAMQWSAASAA